MNGVILIKKEKGCTSHDVVYKVKKLLNEKVGHTGTLDPMATGVLPLLIGKGTLCSKYLINHDKTYIVRLKLGERTTTADSEGEIIERKDINYDCLTQDKINKILKDFIGKTKQIPPIYSAIKVNGKKLYEYARKGQKVEIKPREIEIYDIELIKLNNRTNQIDFKVSCSKGTYIRSLCEDIAKKLDTVGYMEELERIQVGEFNIKDTKTIGELEQLIINQKNNDNKSLDKIMNNNIFFDNVEEINNNCFVNIETLFKDYNSIELDDKKIKLLLNGVKITSEKEDGIYKIYNKTNIFLGIGIVTNNLLKRDIIL